MRRQLIVFGVFVLALGACAWGQPGRDASRSGYNPLETAITAANVGKLGLNWQAAESITGPGGSMPVSDGAHVFRVIGQLNGDMTLLAYPVDGGAQCTSTQPKVCPAQWSTKLPFAPTIEQPQAIVADGRIFVGGSDSAGRFIVVGFDSARDSACPGSTPTCAPVWRADISAAWGGPRSDLSASGGRLYVTEPTAPAVAAFDVTGGINCTATVPTECTPLFVAGTPVLDAPAIGVGRLFVTGMAFDALGVTGCAAGVCAPLFSVDADPSSQAVAGSLFYAAVGGYVDAFDASGVAGCSGAPVVCARQFRALTPSLTDVDILAVAGDRLVLRGTNGSGGISSLYTLDATGVQGCSGVPKSCAPLWVSALPKDEGVRGSAASGSLLFVVSGSGSTAASLRVFDTHGAPCASPPTSCSALRTLSLSEPNVSAPILTNGHLIVGGRDSVLKVLTLQP